MVVLILSGERLEPWNDWHPQILFDCSWTDEKYVCWKNMLQLLRLKKEHLTEAECLRRKDGEGFRNLKKNSLLIVELFQNIVPSSIVDDEILRMWSDFMAEVTYNLTWVSVLSGSTTLKTDHAQVLMLTRHTLKKKYHIKFSGAPLSLWKQQEISTSPMSLNRATLTTRLIIT